MWIPDPVYKKLPIAYVATGLGLVPVFGVSAPIVISAAMLLLAGLLTHLWRRQPQEVPVSPKDNLREAFEQRRARRLQQMHGSKS